LNAPIFLRPPSVFLRNILFNSLFISNIFVKKRLFKPPFLTQNCFVRYTSQTLVKFKMPKKPPPNFNPKPWKFYMFPIKNPKRGFPPLKHCAPNYKGANIIYLRQEPKWEVYNPKKSLEKSSPLNPGF